MNIKSVFFCMIFVLTGCSTTSSTFSCNKTAGDSCLTIEEVDAMTGYADDPKPDILIIKRTRDANPME